MKTKYLEFKELLEKNITLDKKPKLLLHSCCGPCSSAVLERLKDAFDITIYYYNPNITPLEEFEKRLLVQQELIKKMNLNIDIIVERAPYQVYLDNVGEYLDLEEGSMRCYKCYEFRLKRLSEIACKKGFDYYSTVMSVSPYKNSEYINEILNKYQISDNTKPLYSDFKKEEGYKESIRLSKQYELYRQDYCGCASSIKEHLERVNKTK